MLKYFECFRDVILNQKIPRFLCFEFSFDFCFLFFLCFQNNSGFLLFLELHMRCKYHHCLNLIGYRNCIPNLDFCLILMLFLQKHNVFMLHQDRMLLTHLLLYHNLGIHEYFLLSVLYYNICNPKNLLIFFPL